jgi:hypothetical protein
LTEENYVIEVVEDLSVGTELVVKKKVVCIWNGRWNLNQGNLNFITRSQIY